MLKEYIRKRRNGKLEKVGLLVAVEAGGFVRIGFSLCSKEDKFDKAKAEVIAVGRAYSDKSHDCPPSILGDAEAFAKRCVRYFKGAKLE